MDPHPAATVTVGANGLRFPVLSWGPPGARPIFLLHGFPQEPAVWAMVAETLSKEGFRVFAPYQRGYLLSTRPSNVEGYTFSQFASDILGIADALGVDIFDVAGFGMGGAQAWTVNAMAPGRVRSLTSIRFPHPAAFAHGIQHNPNQREKWRHLEKELGSGGPQQRASRMLAHGGLELRRFLKAIGLPEELIEGHVTRLSEPGSLAAALSWEYAMAPAEFAGVPRTSTPTLLIWSEGPALDRTSIETTRSYVGARYSELLIPDVGNFILERASVAVLPMLRQHLRLS